MKRMNLGLALPALLGPLAMAASALSAPRLAAAESLTLRMSRGIEVGALLSGYQYKEPGLMKNSGKKTGLSLGVTEVFDDFFVTGNVRYMGGEVDYSSPTSGRSDGHSDQLLEMRGVVGYDIEFDGFVLAPHIGFGLRTLNNDLRGRTDTGATGYRRQSQYNYLALGAAHRMRLSDDARLVTQIEYDHLLSGRQKSTVSDAVPGFDAVYGNPVNRQKKGLGLRMSVDYEMDNWSLGTYYGYWKIGESDVAALGMYEPKNTTREFGVNAKYRF